MISVECRVWEVEWGENFHANYFDEVTSAGRRESFIRWSLPLRNIVLMWLREKDARAKETPFLPSKNFAGIF